MEAVRLVRATHDDFEALIALVREYYAYDDVPVLQVLEDGVRGLLDSPGYGAAWFIEVDECRAGYAVLTYGYDHEIGGRLGVLTDFFLSEPFRGRGLGTVALNLIETEARKEGLRMIELVTQPDNDRARAVYGKRGFRISPRIAMVKSLD